LESNIISDYSLDSFIKANSTDKNNDKDSCKGNWIMDYAVIAEKYGFKEKNVKTIINKIKNPNEVLLGDYTLNPHFGCSFDCEYCYINGSKYADSTESLYIKSNAVELLKHQLKQKAKLKERAVFQIGSATDPYMDIEKELFLTRDILKLFNRFKFPVHIITKSDLILRDIDILKKINDEAILSKDMKDLKSKVMVSFSFSTIDEEIAKLFEPNTPNIKKRIQAMKKLKKEGFMVGVCFMPMLPYISDTEVVIDGMMSVFKDIGCDYVLSYPLTLFGNTANDSKTKYYKILDKNFPDLVSKTEKLFKGNDYPLAGYQSKIYKRVAKVSKKYGMKNAMI